MNPTELQTLAINRQTAVLAIINLLGLVAKNQEYYRFLEDEVRTLYLQVREEIPDLGPIPPEILERIV